MSWLARCKYLKGLKILEDSKYFATCVENRLNNGVRIDLGNENHIYRKRFSRDEIIQKLEDSIVYNDGKIVALNKPYGVGMIRPNKTQQTFYLTRSLNDYYMQDFLPDLSDRLGFSHLQAVKTIDRYASGVLILAGTDSEKEKISKAMKCAGTRYLSTDTYLVICLGRPKVPEAERKFAVAMKCQGEGRKPEVLSTWSKKMQKKRLVKIVFWEHKVLAATDQASLVRVRSNGMRKHALRLLMATKFFSPILGDHIFGNRVKKVMGVQLPTDSDSNGPQVLDEKIISALDISPREIEIVPTHIHLHCVHLPLINNADFFVSVPPPETFLWTCCRLGLKMDNLL